MGRYCSECNDWCSREDFSFNQWKKGDGYSRCFDCTQGRYCSECDDLCSREDFSSNQWRKGDGCSRCLDCTQGNNNTYSYECHKCYKTFDSQNSLNMHMQVHRPRNVSCPICGDCRFRSGANAVQHVESGYCSGCKGRNNARNNIYQFARSQRAMQPYMTGTPMLTNGGYRDGSTPDYPYHCYQCNKQFRHLSQLLQHNDQKHGQMRMLQY
mmetsp:Transcript_30490/g.45403  ORF Transcript_30490/g.45403 Transcript_30490/m.45403 type:complete len:211 (-) Transcript_30490:363-995(-)